MNTYKIKFIEHQEIDQLIVLCQAHAKYEKADYSNKNIKQKLLTNIFSNSPMLHCLVLEKNHKIEGYLSYTKQFSTWLGSEYIYLDCLFINDDHRCFGQGEKMINKLINESKKLNCELIQWQTPIFNKRAIKFYNRK